MVSTLNAPKGLVIADAAIVPAGLAQARSNVYVTNHHRMSSSTPTATSAHDRCCGSRESHAPR